MLLNASLLLLSMLLMGYPIAINSGPGEHPQNETVMKRVTQNPVETTHTNRNLFNRKRFFIELFHAENHFPLWMPS
jgi:hypothetical protein